MYNYILKTHINDMDYETVFCDESDVAAVKTTKKLIKSFLDQHQKSPAFYYDVSLYTLEIRPIVNNVGQTTMSRCLYQDLNGQIIDDITGE